MFAKSIILCIPSCGLLIIITESIFKSVWEIIWSLQKMLLRKTQINYMFFAHHRLIYRTHRSEGYNILHPNNKLQADYPDQISIQCLLFDINHV